MGTEQDRIIKKKLLNKLKRMSENKYFQERCTGGCKQTDFWQTIKPYFSKKAANSDSTIIFKEKVNIVSKIVTFNQPVTKK